ncbi:MAG: enoyl-CoA hydratase/isomerase family protein [Frankiaceae bacterium]|nr:enoyl-CoA hydratase/isomerase family protein [Frankiaceae bacterium]MBV9872982.1 enoyl-CoA hydratase/isomerase family protein [Frankiaceae bacterium]
MTDGISYVVADEVATITLDRPDSLNSLTVAMKVELLAALQRAREDAQVRSVVLTGAGRAFCVGQDLGEHKAALDSGDTALSTVPDHYNPIVEALTALPKPVIAAVNGVAAGAGASLTFACDIRIAADTSSFLMAFARVGLGPDSGSSWTLQRLVGAGRATAMMLLAEPVAAPQALEMGLVSAVVPAEDLTSVVDALATKLAGGPTAAYAAIKDTVAYAASHTLSESLANEAAAQARCGATADHAHAVEAFLTKQPASFTGH